MTHDVLGEDSALALETAASVIAYTDIADWASWSAYLLEKLEEDQAPADDLYVEMLENLIAMCVYRIDNGEWE